MQYIRSLYPISEIVDDETKSTFAWILLGFFEGKVGLKFGSVLDRIWPCLVRGFFLLRTSRHERHIWGVVVFLIQIIECVQSV